MQHSEFIAQLAKWLSPKVYVEFGVGYAGPHTYPYMVNNFHQCEVYGVDIVDLKNNLPKRNGAHFFHGTTDAFMKQWNKDKMIDLCFIDADHVCHEVINDVERVLPYIQPDTGIICLHDTWPPSKDYTSVDKCNTAYQAPYILKNKYSSKELEILTIPAPYGITLIRKVGDDWRNKS